MDDCEDDELIVRRLREGAPGTLGVFGFSFLEAHRSEIQAAIIEGVADSGETIANGSYPLSRPICLCAKRQHVEMFSFVAAFLDGYVSDRAMGPNGYLLRAGLMSLDQAGLLRLQQTVRERAVMTRLPERQVVRRVSKFCAKDCDP